jgi:sugar-specific transcriptional regulator TrmB
MLDVLGLDELQERAYRRLVQLPSESAEVLAGTMKSELPDVLTALEALEDKGLVARSVATPDHYVASPPALALGSLIVQRQDDIRRAQLELGALTELYRGGASERTHTDVIDVVRGRQAVAQHVAQLQRGAKREVYALVRTEVAVVSAEENVDEEIALGRGVTYQVVLERTAFERPGFSEMVEESVQRGELVRVADTVPLRMLIADRKLALLPLMSNGTGGEVGALLVHPGGLLDALLALFDLVWQQANPMLATDQGVLEESAGQLDEVDLKLLTLLQVGLTDQTIVGQLGLSLRTVQRRVHQLMEIAGVATRFQLGSEAARRGWLSR